MTNITFKRKWGSMRARSSSPLAALGNSFRSRRGRPQYDRVDRSRMRATVSFPLAAFGSPFKARRERQRDGRADCSRESGGTRDGGHEGRREDGEAPREREYEYFYEEEACRNIFDEPLIVRRRRRRRRTPRPELLTDVPASASARSSVEISEGVLPNPMLEAAPMLDDLSATTPQPEDPSDVQASVIAQHCAENFEEVRPNSRLEVASMTDDMSALTPYAFFQDVSSVCTSMIGQVDMRTELEAINQNSSGALSYPQGANDLVKAVPLRDIKGDLTVPPNSTMEVELTLDDYSAMTPYTFFRDCNTVSMSMVEQVGMMTELGAIDKNSSRARSNPQVANDLRMTAPSQDIKVEHLQHLTTDLPALRAVVEQCVQAGEEPEALDIVTQALIIDNGISMSEDTALFCLTTLGDLAHIYENTHRMISEGTAVNAVIEAMQLYRGKSSEVHMSACEVLWCLTIYQTS